MTRAFGLCGPKVELIWVLCIALSVAIFSGPEMFTGAHLRSYSGKRRARHGIRVTPDVYCKRQRNLMDLEVARGDLSQGQLELPNMVMARAKLKLGSSYLHLAATLVCIRKESQVYGNYGALQ
ncbi:hypothetical protein K438DRAFT_1779799 [Mycena galopus ATCC 62051]|nr:hypothetical protein K438DRAFT_1779799 [Mycena galopus ATCC 62051]